MKKTRILAVSDIHGDSDLVMKLAKRAKKESIDLVVLCGDLTGWKQTRNFIKPFKDLGKEVLIIPGNHESFATADVLANIYGVKNIHGYSFVFNDIGFFGAGGADIGIGRISERELMTTLKKAHDGLDGVKKKIMVTHMHPRGSLSEFSGFKGSDSIRKAVEKFSPEFLLHGHIHEAGGLYEKVGKTKIVNVGRSGAIIEI
jgi:Icc-related predicted phosphoesterase